MEVIKVVQIMMYGAYNLTVMLSVPTLMTLVMLMVYYKEKGEFDSATVFTAMAVLYLIRMPLMMLPMAIGSYVMASVSLTRIKRFLLLPDNTEAAAILRAASAAPKMADSAAAGVANATSADPAASSAKPGRVEVWGEYSWNAVPTNETTETSKSTETDAAAADGKSVGSVAQEDPEEGKAKIGAEAEAEGLTSTPKEKQAPFSLSVYNGSDGSTDRPLVIEPGQLVAVVGQVGSGKTSFLSSILGEMTAVGAPRAPGAAPTDPTDPAEAEKAGSKVAYAATSAGTKTAYAAQNAWIMNATLKDNIIFGYETDTIRYNETIDVCALEADLKELEAGELTEIGEKGINLSGGQQARVSLARAVYADADLYLLDDIFSAVDAHVGKHLFNKCVGPNGILGTAGKTRIVCTNQLHLVPQVDVVLVLNEGAISEQGSYEELMASNGAFAQLMRDYGDADDQQVSSSEASSASTAASVDLFCGTTACGADAATDAAISDIMDLPPPPSKLRSMSSGSDDGSRFDGAGPGAKTPREKGQLIVKEEKALGTVKMETWLQYFSKSAGGPGLLAFLIFITIAAQVRVEIKPNNLCIQDFFNTKFLYAHNPARLILTRTLVRRYGVQLVALEVDGCFRRA
mmetsp:Transcript_45992/g.127822  ORF Transcript_45992/g.127822 Transcript_45992/m.127822 type:complete len:630 (-) Transcript_45992:2353-4242(-)